MRVTKPIVLGAAALFGLGLTTAFAANTHGAAVSALAHQSKASLSGMAFGDAISDFAMTNGKAGTAPATTTADRANHGEAVSAVATSNATAAHRTGAGKVNHGGAVSAAAQKR